MSTTINTGMYKYAKDADVLREIEETIRQNPDAFRKDGVVSVSAGYKAVGGWLTRKPAIVVTVERKTDDVPAEQMLPVKFGPFAVDVRQASPAEILRARSLHRYAALADTGRKEFTLPSAAILFNPATAEIMPTEASLADRAPKPQINYEPAPKASLGEVSEPMSLVCHASPDAGWLVLSDFFGGVETGLSVGMYDFTSAHVLQGLADAMRGKEGGLKLVIDHPPRNPSADQTDEETVAALGGDEELKTDVAWALVRSSRMAPRWIYPTAYHIKVAVRDGSSIWLSSGNWNNSNQPAIDPWNDREEADSVAERSDRDWHIVVNHEGLAQTFKAFLEHDLEVAKDAEAGGTAGPLADTLENVDAAGQPAAELPELAEIIPQVAPESRPPVDYFRPRRIPEGGGTKRIRIQPLLTPDNYYGHVSDLIRSTQTSFYMQTQYIHPSDKETDRQFADLINALIELQQSGLDVRVILSEYAAQGGWLDKMQAVGIDLSAVRIQTGVHNKGIIVDSSVVMLSSQNWSGDGVLHNRDAGLIAYDEEAAKYYEEIFIHDWKYLASQVATL